MRISARYKLIEVITENSESKQWESAVQEWDMVGCEIDPFCSSKCVCGQENIKYLFHIENDLNGNHLFPIGSRCIKKFGRKDLDELVNVHEQMCKLLEAVKNNQFIEFSSKLFSKKLLLFLYENDAFPATTYNMGNPERDYQFLLDMFSKRNDPTTLQKKKINALIIQAIIPFCKQRISEKSV